MRLLDTTTGRFFWAEEPQKFRYAILSHVWEGDTEQTYEEVVAIHRSSTSKVVLSSLSKKIRGACIIAQGHGLPYIWIDSCCINKEISAELS